MLDAIRRSEERIGWTGYLLVAITLLVPQLSRVFAQDAVGAATTQPAEIGSPSANPLDETPPADADAPASQPADETARRPHLHGRLGVPEPQIVGQKMVDTLKTPPWEWPQLWGDWFGLRPELLDRGVDVHAWWVLDWSQNWHGGLNTEGFAFRHLFGLDVALDTEPMLGIPGGTLFMQYYHHKGANASEDDTGDFQAFSNIDENGLSQVAELWYEQKLLDDKLRIKIGKLDANSEFAYVENGLEFIHSSPGFSPTIVGFPSYPDPAMSVNVFVYPTDWSYLGFGIYDGAAQEGYRTGARGPSTFAKHGLFYIGEAGLTWEGGDRRLNGRVALGGYYHNGPFERFDPVSESSDPITQNGADGFYLMWDQTLWREQPDNPDDAQGLGMFLSYGRGDPDVAEADHGVFGGLAWTGLLPERDDDVVGIGADYVHFSQEGKAGFTDNHELAYELFYKWQVTPAVAIKPDFQYITNPGGGGLSDAFVGTLRLEIAF